MQYALSILPDYNNNTDFIIDKCLKSIIFISYFTFFDVCVKKIVVF